MRTPRMSIALAALAAAALLAAPTAQAADKDPGKAIVIADGPDRSVSISIADGEVTVIETDGDASTVSIVDLDQVGVLVKDGLAQAAQVLSELQLDMHVGADNRLEFSDGDRTFEVDVDAIASEVARALQQGLGSMDTAGWTSTHDHDADTADLEAELAKLKRELAKLQKELDARGDI
ncbi:MAG TPA: hypothetical protein PLQ13_06380 [Candidatus Krumholzibacteria bacterium]|nr:hypothetical protein [Candidatus Krumholzibacteria bacterium]